MTILVDTSALYAILDRSDAHHRRAAEIWRRLLVDDAPPLTTHDFVLVETTALAQARLGMEAVTGLHRAVLPVIEVAPVDAALQERAVTALLASGRRSLSLADWVSFQMMWRDGITTALAFDTDFTDQGFEVIPE